MQTGVASSIRYAVSPISVKGGEAMSVFEAISLMLAFAVLIIMLINYLDKRK